MAIPSNDEFRGRSATSYGYVSACRGFDDVAVEEIDLEIVILDAETLHYRSLNRETPELYILCD